MEGETESRQGVRICVLLWRFCVAQKILLTTDDLEEEERVRGWDVDKERRENDKKYHPYHLSMRERIHRMEMD